MEATPETMDWQSWAAPGVVALVVLAMVFRLVFRGRKKPGGCGKCGSDHCH